MIKIHCRLAELLNDKRVTTEELTIASGISKEKIDEYSKGEMDSISFQEIGIILSVLGCSSVSDLLEEVPIANNPPIMNDVPPMAEAEWNSSCPRSPDGKHTGMPKESRQSAGYIAALRFARALGLSGSLMAGRKISVLVRSNTYSCSPL